MIIRNNQTVGGLKRLAFFSISILLFLTFQSFNKKGKEQEGFVFEYGKASYYGRPFIGRKTANGEIFTENEYTCAHKSLPFGTKLKVTNLENNQSIIVRVNDRGPFVKTRIVDLSIQGARELGLMSTGVANVSIEIVHSKFSSLGNTKKMEKLVVDNVYAYINIEDDNTIDKVYAYLLETDQLEKATEDGTLTPSNKEIKKDDNLKLGDKNTSDNIESIGTSKPISTLDIEK